MFHCHGRYSRTVVDDLRSSKLFRNNDSREPYFEKIDIPSFDLTTRAPATQRLPPLAFSRGRRGEYIFIRLPHVPFSILAPFLENRFYQSEEPIRFKWNPLVCGWHIEYGTAPREAGVPLNEYVQIKRLQQISYDVANVAQEWYPHNNDKKPGTSSRMLWCQTLVHVFQDHDKTVCLRMQRNYGIGFTAHRRVYSLLAKLVTDHALFLTRYAYLQVIEGCSEYKTRHPIFLYLFDDFASREICTYIQDVGVTVDKDGDDEEND